MRALFLSLLVLLSAAVSAQTAAPGRLLVATETLADDSSFAQTVVLLLQHGENGSAGLIINRPTWVEPGEAFPELEALNDRLGAIYLGGPVGHANLSALVHGPVRERGGVHRVVEEVYFTDRDGLRALTADESEPRQIRLYAGLASWEAGELEREIERGAWRVTAARTELVFSPEPRQLWRQLHERRSELVVVGPMRRSQPGQPAAAAAEGGGSSSRLALR